MKVNRFPIWVISRPECSAILIELIAENQIPLRSVTCSFCVELLLCIVINESWVARQIGYLASSVTPAKVVAECDEWRCIVEGDDGVSSKQCDETGHEKHEDRYVGPTSRREDGERTILSRVNTWVRIMERIIKVWIFRVPQIRRNSGCVWLEHWPFTRDGGLLGRRDTEARRGISRISSSCSRGVMLRNNQVRPSIKTWH